MPLIEISRQFVSKPYLQIFEVRVNVMQQIKQEPPIGVQIRSKVLNCGWVRTWVKINKATKITLLSANKVVIH